MTQSQSTRERILAVIQWLSIDEWGAPAKETMLWKLLSETRDLLLTGTPSLSREEAERLSSNMAERWWDYARTPLNVAIATALQQADSDARLSCAAELEQKSQEIAALEKLRATFDIALQNVIDERDRLRERLREVEVLYQRLRTGLSTLGLDSPPDDPPLEPAQGRLEHYARAREETWGHFAQAIKQLMESTPASALEPPAMPSEPFLGGGSMEPPEPTAPRREGE